MISDKDFDSLFNEICSLTYSELIYFSSPFIKKDTITEIEFWERFYYDLDSLLAVTLYKTLQNVSEELTKTIPEAIIKKYMGNLIIQKSNYSKEDMSKADIIYSSIMAEKDSIRKFYSRLEENYSSRNTENLKYFDAPNNFSSKLFIEDIHYYLLLKGFPQIKRFLLKDDFIIWNTESFFEDLDGFYKAIETYNGYYKFDLYHKFEKYCKMELCYKALTKIKCDKRRYKWNDQKVQEQIDKIRMFHTVPTCPPHAMGVIQDAYPDIHNPIHSSELPRKTLNEIVFDIELLMTLDNLGYYRVAVYNVQQLNYIMNSVASILTPGIVRKMLYHYNFQNLSAEERFLEFEKMLSSPTVTNFYNDYINKKIHITSPKNVSEDITLTHFKKLYNIPLEKR